MIYHIIARHIMSAYYIITYHMISYHVIILYHNILEDGIYEGQDEGQKVATRKVEDGRKTLFPVTGT